MMFRTPSSSFSPTGWAPSRAAELAVATDDRRLAELQVDVTGAEFHGASEQTVEIHAARMGDRPREAEALALYAGAAR